MNDSPVNYEPGDAAERLGISASGLRRLAAAYEEVHGDLPRKVGTKARLYPEPVLTEIAKARALVDAGRYASNTEALDALKRGLEPDTTAELTPSTDQATPRALTLLLEEQRATRLELQALRQEIAELRALPVATPERIDQALKAEMHGPMVRFALWLESRLRGRS